MAEELDEKIRENAQGPSEASGDSGSMKQHSLKDQIQAARYLNSKQAARSRMPQVRLWPLPCRLRVPSWRCVISGAPQRDCAPRPGRISCGWNQCGCCQHHKEERYAHYRNPGKSES